MTSEREFVHEGTVIDVAEAEQISTLAGNWVEAEKIGDAAAMRAFEDELHERVAFADIEGIRGLEAKTGEPSLTETDRLHHVLKQMWKNASVRRD